MLFKLSLDQRNLDEAVDMGEGERCTRFTRYEPQIYHKTGKTKYTIVSIHLTALVSGLLLPQQTECLIANRFVNAQGGANNKNIAFDEYAQCRKQNCMKVALQDGKHPQAFKRISSSCRNDQTCGKISSASERKGFHHLPSHEPDVQHVLRHLLIEMLLRVRGN